MLTEDDKVQQGQAHHASKFVEAGQVQRGEAHQASMLAEVGYVQSGQTHHASMLAEVGCVLSGQAPGGVHHPRLGRDLPASGLTEVGCVQLVVVQVHVRLEVLVGCGLRVVPGHTTQGLDE